MIHVEKVEMRVYCDIKAETNVCTHGCTRLERSSLMCLITSLPFQEKL